MTTSTSGRPTLLVVYDRGSLGPTRVVEAAAAAGCTVVFAVADTPHAREIEPAMRAFATTVPLADPTALARHRPDGIVTFSESQLEATAALAAEFGLPHHSPTALPAIVGKDEQRECFRRAGLDDLRSYVVTGEADIPAAIAHVGTPAVLKPVVGASSRNTVAVRTPQDCAATLRELLAVESEMLVEQLLVGRTTESPWGDYIAVDCVASAGEVRPLFVTSKFALAPPFRERGGYGGRSVVPADEVREVEELACAAVRALGVTCGVADVEIKLTPSGPRVIEVNGRLGGWVDDLAVRSRTSRPADAAVRAALGQPVDDTLPGPVDGPQPIAFHYLLTAPYGASRLTAIRDLRALRSVPHVDRVIRLAEVGDSVDWHLGAQAATAAVLGTVDTHDELAAVVAEVEQVDWVDYD